MAHLTSQSAGKIFEVEIAGVPLKLKSTHDESTVNDLVRLIDKTINEALPKVKNRSVQTAAVLAALNLAEELHFLKKQISAELDKLENKADRVIHSLEASRIPKTEITV